MGDLNLHADGSQLLRVEPDINAPISIDADAVAHLRPHWLISKYLGLHPTGRRTQYLIMNPYLTSGLFFTGDPSTQPLYFDIVSFAIEPTVALLQLGVDALSSLTLADEGDAVMHEAADATRISLTEEAASAQVCVAADATAVMHIHATPSPKLHIASDAFMHLTIKPDEP